MVHRTGWKALVWWLTALCVVLIVAVAGLVVAYSAADHARATCRVWHDVASAPIPPNTSEFGLRISADARWAVTHMGCKNTELPPPDRRILPYLNANR